MTKNVFRDEDFEKVVEFSESDEDDYVENNDNFL